jgi:para-aminobenzoate synthetase/4-amino-4-deoxychorismate lyase
MQIIAALEKHPRRIYTGALGYLAPARRAQFNVAIRTVLIDRRAAQAEYGLGGGIVWDSEGRAELQEAYAKARVLTQPAPRFELLETILWEPESGFRHLDAHLARLADSANYFSAPLAVDALRGSLSALTATLAPHPQRVRVLAALDGETRLEASPLAALPNPYRVRLARRPVDSRDVFLYHKTTWRKVYDEARRGWPDCEDVILFNERGELTESAIASLVLERDGAWLTPPVACGLLPGVERARLLAEGRLQEAVLTVDDQHKADRILLVNSVRGIWQAVLIKETT